MKKYTFLLYHKDYEDFIHKLYDVGVVQIVEKDAEDEIYEPLENSLSNIKKYNEVINHLKTTAEEHEVKNFKPAVNSDSISNKIDEYDKLVAEQERIEQDIQTLRKDITALSLWGDFEHDKLKGLEEYGYHVNFFSTPSKSFNDEWIDEFNAVKIGEEAAHIYFVTITKEKELEIDADKVKIPQKRLSILLTKEDNLKKELEKIEKDYVVFAEQNLKTIQSDLSKIQTDFDFSKARIDTDSIIEEKVRILEGWVPEKKEPELISMLNDTDVVYTSREPKKDEAAPILLKNNKLNRLFEPIGDLYDLPTYGELDLTPFFAPFYMLFFGLCLGDAGYGLVLCILALIIKRKKPKMKRYMNLLLALGIATVIMGTVSATFFGVQLLNIQWPWFEKFKVIMMDPDQLFNNALIIGAVQITFGMFIKVFNRIKAKDIGGALSTIGWLIIILGCGLTFLLSKKGIITPNVSKIMYWSVIGVAAIFIFILNNLKRNIFINMGLGIWDVYNMATGILGDVLSYIRLFALGISGSVMGFVFNDLAMNLSPDIPVLKQIVMLLILVFGHGINIFMSGLSAFVHPMRLTFVEFYKNAGFMGGGEKFNPFAENKIELETEIEN